MIVLCLSLCYLQLKMCVCMNVHVHTNTASTGRCKSENRADVDGQTTVVKTVLIPSQLSVFPALLLLQHFCPLFPPPYSLLSLPMLAPCLSVWAWVCVHSSLWSIWLFSNGASVGSRVCCPWISFQMSLLLNGQVWLACACVSTTH